MPRMPEAFYRGGNVPGPYQRPKSLRQFDPPSRLVEDDEDANLVLCERCRNAQ